MGFYIAEQTLKDIREQLSLHHEICGVLDIHDLEIEGTKMIIPSSTVFKGDSSGQKSCEVPKEEKSGRESPLLHDKEELKYHTHPISSYSYPSFEDLFSVMKRRSDGRSVSSFIFTKWGVWTLFPTDNKIEIKNIKFYEDKYNDNQNIRIFRRDTEVFKRSHQSKDVGDVAEYIWSYVEEVNKLFKKYIVIHLYTWEDIEKDYGKMKDTPFAEMVYFEV